MSPYRHPAPRLPDPRPKRSTLRRLARVGDRSCRLYLPFTFRWRRVPRKVGAHALCAALYSPPAALVNAWPAWAMWPLLFAIGFALWAVVDVVMGYLRLRRVRRATRAWASGPTVTTFPALAAYREAARTGDWAAFAAKDLRPVTVHLRGLDDRVLPDRERKPR